MPLGGVCVFQVGAHCDIALPTVCCLQLEFNSPHLELRLQLRHFAQLEASLFIIRAWVIDSGGDGRFGLAALYMEFANSTE